MGIYHDWKYAFFLFFPPEVSKWRVCIFNRIQIRYVHMCAGSISKLPVCPRKPLTWHSTAAQLRAAAQHQLRGKSGDRVRRIWRLPLAEEYVCYCGWTKSISHQFETNGNHCWLVFTGESSFQGFLGAVCPLLVFKGIFITTGCACVFFSGDSSKESVLNFKGFYH